MEPPTITGSSTIALERLPACDASTSMACASRTFSGVPAGTVTASAARRPLARRGGRLALGWGAGGGGGFRAENSTATASVERHLGHLAVVEQDAHASCCRRR